MFLNWAPTSATVFLRVNSGRPKDFDIDDARTAT
jgi:hypothetical protein